MSATQIEDALRLWQEQQVQMIQGLNRWIDNPAVRSRDGWVNAPDRRRAADRLMACWRETLREVRSAEAVANDYALDLSGLTVGDLPALPITFRHVGTLDLSNVGLTTASDAFLRAFPRLESLMLNGNGLGALPDAVTGLERLTRLSAHHNELSDAPLLQRQLRALPQLQQVDLETNHLDSFDVAGLDRLQVLNLNYNRLSDWPAGVLEAPALTTLGLRSNYNIETIPVGAFLPEHNALMAGTDLSDNMLEEREFLRLQEYQRETGRGLGFTPHDIDELLAGFHSEAEDDEPGLALHPENETPEQAKARWFTGGAADSERQAVWDTVMAQDARMVQEDA
ncbi:leucine-rich repeat domain-containing protein [Pseudomonas sp. VD9]|uniref:leucine-rich repeat domain-containing protein n=1 Tax=Pseudomonas sp. VD9 TaxID=3342076 RepID=UPI003C6CB141